MGRKLKSGKNADMPMREKLERIVKLRLDGWTLDAIAKEMGYATAFGVRQALLRAISKAPPPPNIEALRQKELAVCDEVEREAWEQWYRSTKSSNSRTEAETKDGTFVTEKTEDQSGNPALLDKVLKAAERRAKLLGLDAPQRIDLKKEDDAWDSLQGKTPEEWTAEIRERLNAGADAARNRGRPKRVDDMDAET